MTPILDDGSVAWREVMTDAKVELSDDGFRGPSDPSAS